jgi:phospholipase C
VGIDGRSSSRTTRTADSGITFRRRRATAGARARAFPAIVISPFAKRGYVDHTHYDTTSIIKFITRRFASSRCRARAGAGDLTNALDLAL